jgi:hypothetical protein
VRVEGTDCGLHEVDAKIEQHGAYCGMRNAGSQETFVTCGSLRSSCWSLPAAARNGHFHGTAVAQLVPLRKCGLG